jgi:hypothetical protein
MCRGPGRGPPSVGGRLVATNRPALAPAQRRGGGRLDHQHREASARISTLGRAGRQRRPPLGSAERRSACPRPAAVASAMRSRTVLRAYPKLRAIWRVPLPARQCTKLGQVLLLRLVEALDRAAGLRVIRPGILVPHAQPLELGLQHHFPAAVLGGEDAAVVGKHRRGGAVTRTGLLEDPAHVNGGGHREGDRGPAQPAVVVDEVHDLGTPTAGERPVGHVRLPALAFS